MSRIQDVAALIRGLQTVINAGVQTQDQYLRVLWRNSSVRSVLVESCGIMENKFKNASKPSDIIKAASDSVERVNTVLHSVKEYTVSTANISVDQIQKNSKTKPETSNVQNIRVEEYQIKLTPQEKAYLKKLDKEHRAKMEKQNMNKPAMEISAEKNDSLNPELETEKDNDGKPKAKLHSKAKQMLNPTAKQRTVPSSRIGRMVSFGSLAAGLGIGTVAEFTRRSLGIGEKTEESISSMFLTPANTERIVETLCKVRGAALKIGQILSIQDESIVSPQIAKAFERVRRSADFMPTWQVEKVLKSEFGENWNDNFEEFDMKPFAAASIGQVHWGRAKNGKEIAIKIQYPGVARGIESDIDNLVGIMKVWNIFPEGMFIDNLVVVAKRELAWEVDYVREAECTKKFKKLLEPYPEYFVPEVFDNLSTSQVFTTGIIEGIPVDQCVDLDLEVRKNIARHAMKLCVLELLEFQFMQTDPNWANFFYDPKTEQLLLLDFGASRSYSKPFMDIYVKIIKAASDGDRATVLNLSKDLGFLTGYESKLMEEAHVDAVMILGEVFRCKGEFDFAQQETTKQIQNLVPTMLTHRLCPPPEEIYSIHRKLSGVFLLCSKLKVSIACREMFLEKYNNYKFD